MNIFISCVSEKADHKCKAKELYISPLFQKAYAYAQSLNPEHIYILSAKYYVVGLDEVIAPYDLTLNDMNAEEKREWAENVIKKMKSKHINLNEKTIFLAGHNYVDYLTDYFTDFEIPYQDNNLEGIGYILEWLDKQLGAEKTAEINKFCEDLQFKNKKNIDMNNKINRIKLAKMIMKFGELETDKGILLYEGDLAVGLEVFVEGEDGELIAAPDGEYMVENIKYIVAEGKIADIVEPEVEDNPEDVKPAENKAEELEDEKPAEEPDPRDAEIETLKAEKADLEAKVNELSEIIAQRDKEIEDLKSQLNMSAAKPAHKEIKGDFTINKKENGVLKYFQ